MKKACGSKLSQPYSVDDKFEYVVVEIGGMRSNLNSEIDMYLGNFCFIPKAELIKQGILSSPICKGKESMYICSPDYSGSHWSKQYWVCFQ